MASCAKIAAGVAFVCPPPPAGVDAGTLCLFNYDDVDFSAVTYGVGAPTNVTAFALKGVTTGFIFEGINNSVRPSYISVTEGYNPFKFTHSLEYRIFADGRTITEIESDLAGGSFVAFFFSKSQSVKVAFLKIGSRAVVSRNFYEEEGAALITLTTPDGEFETTPIMEYIGNGTDSFDVLKAAIIALC